MHFDNQILQHRKMELMPPGIREHPKRIHSPRLRENQAIGVLAVQGLIKAFQFTLLVNSKTDGLIKHHTDYQGTDHSQSYGGPHAFDLHQQLIPDAPIGGALNRRGSRRLKNR